MFDVSSDLFDIESEFSDVGVFRNKLGMESNKETTVSYKLHNVGRKGCVQ